jgi:uncharacterized protein (TIGR03437 family)
MGETTTMKTPEFARVLSAPQDRPETASRTRGPAFQFCAALLLLLVPLGLMAQDSALTIVAVSPASGATAVSVGTTVEVQFNQPMIAGSLDSSFTLQIGSNFVACALSTDSSSGEVIGATLTPSSALSPGTLYTATVTTGAQSTSINSLAQNYVWTFTTAGTAFGVATASPANGATGVAVSVTPQISFNEPADGTTINVGTFTLQAGATPVPGDVVLETIPMPPPPFPTIGASFHPSSALLPGTTYTATVTTGAESASDVALATNYVWTFTTAGAPTGSITVVTTAVGGDGTFTITSNFGVTSPVTTVSGTASQTISGLTPGSNYNLSETLPADWTPTSASCTNGSASTAAIVVSAGVTTTCTFTNTFTPPSVSSTVPANNATSVAVASALSATFSEAMSPLTINTSTFTLLNGLTPVPGTVSYAGVTATFTPSSALPANTLFTATITTGAQDQGGNAIVANYVWTFTTGAAPDLTPPTVSSTVPAPAELAVPIGNALSATFSEALNPLTVSASSFTLRNGPTPILGIVTYAGVTATFTPLGTLEPNAFFTATITTAIMDLAGNALQFDYVWNFATGAAPDLTPPSVSSTAPANGATNVPIGNALSVVFSEPLNPLTVSTATFTVMQGITPVLGAVTYAGVTATFTPLSALAFDTLYTATLTTGVMDLAGNALAANFAWTFTTGAALDSTPPTVSSTVPASGATNIPIGNALSATFSQAMNPLEISTSTFTLQNGPTPVPGTVAYDGVTATFTPLAALPPNTLLTATITTGATDLASTALVSNYVWSFTTGALFDTTRPTVNSTVPIVGAINVGVGNPLSAVFSEAMNPLTISTATFNLRQGAKPIAGTVTYNGVTATFTPLNVLAPNTFFTATITTGVTDLAGNAPVFNYSWSFTTGAANPTPAVISTFPANGAILVTPSANVVANFNQLLNTLLTNSITFTLQQGTTPVPGTVTFAGTFATFDPTFNLAPNTIYTATLTDTTTNPAARTLTGSLVWSFTTGSSVDQAAVCLSNFAVLSGMGIISSGASTITGDIGVSAGASITGFPPGTLTGAVYAGDAAAAQGILDLSAAYANAVGRLVGAVAVAGDLGGQTFTAGLYNSVSSLSVIAGNLTLDAKGDPNAVFIFQMASTLTTAPGTQVILTGGASASNVFWQVGTSATLGANSVFSGSILANQSITLNLGAAVNGRLLAENGTVTLASNIIVSPPPSISVGGFVNAASDAQTAAAGSIETVFGHNLGSALTTASGYPLPISLGGSSFQVGTEAAPLYMTSCSQQNIQIPWDAVGQVTLTATVGGLVSTGEAITIVPFSPGIFSLNQGGSGQGAVEIAATGQLAAPLADAGVPVKRGEYIAIFATGLGPVSNQPANGAAALSDPLSSTLTTPIVTIGGTAAKVTYSGLAPGFAGLYQVNALVPDGAPTGNSVSLYLSIGGVQSNSVTIAVQ